jgi:hypothetical protein
VPFALTDSLRLFSKAITWSQTAGSTLVGRHFFACNGEKLFSDHHFVDALAIDLLHFHSVG